MLSTNVLCLKKRKKRSYCISSRSPDCYLPATDKSNRPIGSVVAMLQITEDTPPDMLAGAMDLTVHLPTNRTVKMSVERSTPMMDLLVQITTNHHLQLSGYTLHALGMAPSADLGDKILPYKPNTPIGALDTQHIRVVQKARTLPVPKSAAPGHQPFESTFRLKVHLPRNQLYVTRVSQSVQLVEIMRKVCEEKNLDVHKYEFRHPGNLDEVLDPKLTLSDYKITEVYIVLRGSGSLNQAFSTSDIMALRKEEERKQMHNKTGGGVFNLIFRRGKSSTTGSLSSDNRSISPTHSDDSRSVTPPNVQPILTPQPEMIIERPKPPQRKRRPAPKPPQENNNHPQGEETTQTSKSEPEHKEETTTTTTTTTTNKTEGLTISHSRNSSDSSGYHEASILSEHCNTSLPRRPKSAIINEEIGGGDVGGGFSRSTGNLSKMGVHSKSTSSLAFTARKKKSAPPPPSTVLSPASSVSSLEKSSPVVASQPSPIVEPSPDDGKGQDATSSPSIAPLPLTNSAPPPAPRTRSIKPPIPRPRHIAPSFAEIKEEAEAKKPDLSRQDSEDDRETPSFAPRRIEEAVNPVVIDDLLRQDTRKPEATRQSSEDGREIDEAINAVVIDDLLLKEPRKPELTRQEAFEIQTKELPTEEVEGPRPSEEERLGAQSKLVDLQKQSLSEFFRSDTFSPPKAPEVEERKPPEVVAMFPKPIKETHSKSMFDSFTRKRGFQIGSSLLASEHEDEDMRSLNSSGSNGRGGDLSSMNSSVMSALNSFNFVDEIDDVDVEMFSGSISKGCKRGMVLNQLHGMHEFEAPAPLPKNSSWSSLRSVGSIPGFAASNGAMKKWDNLEELDNLSQGCSSSSGANNVWVIGDAADSEVTTSTPKKTTDTHQIDEPFNSPKSEDIDTTPSDGPSKDNNRPTTEPVAEPLKEVEYNWVKDRPTNPKPTDSDKPRQHFKIGDLQEPDWHYHLPSPPRGFRDSSPVIFGDHDDHTGESMLDSVVTSPELFEKLSEVVSRSEEVEDRPILNKLSLENLEKRKSLVYNRELATSLKMTDNNGASPVQQQQRQEETFTSSLAKFERTLEEIKQQQSSPRHSCSSNVSTGSNKNNGSTLPNFKITTYDPKKKIDIFEDDTIRSTANQNKRHSFTETVGKSHSTVNYQFHKPQFNVFRSESFSQRPPSYHNKYQPQPAKPVTRSKSQVALNNTSKYTRERKSSVDQGMEESVPMSKSNSLFDVSGLQSLGVMRLIQNKLNTPTNSTEKLDQSDKAEPEQFKVVQSENVKYTNYHTPSINMGTWSDRPKVPVNVKDDPDYKHSRLIVNNDIRSHNSIAVNSPVSVKVNGSSLDPISGHSNNVLIKIGEAPRPFARKPLGSVNKIGRPHSVAFGNDFDISRVPIVRSVEFKKPYKDLNNTSVTQIYQPGVFKSTEEPRNYLNGSATPTVRGFKSWGPSHGYSTLPMKPRDFAQVNGTTVNKSVPFSQSNLRRTESTKVNENGAAPPPPPPSLPKLKMAARSSYDGGSDPKEELLQAIREFGGKKGLRAVKA